jgi:hypothetical protein
MKKTEGRKSRGSVPLRINKMHKGKSIQNLTQRIVTDKQKIEKNL